MFALMVDARRKVFEREHNGRAWLAFHIANLPNQKRAIPLSDLMISRKSDAPSKAMSGAEIETVMRHWRFATAGLSRATAAPKRPSNHLK